MTEVDDDEEEEKQPLIPFDEAMSLPAAALAKEVKRIYRLAAKWSFDLSA